MGLTWAFAWRWILSLSDPGKYGIKAERTRGSDKLDFLLDNRRLRGCLHNQVPGSLAAALADKLR